MATLQQIDTPHIQQPAPAQVLLSDAQLRTLQSLVDAVIRRHTPEEVEDIMSALPVEADETQRRAARIYAERCFSDYEGNLDALLSQFTASFSDNNKFQTRMLMTVLDTRPGCLLLSGHLGPFSALDPITREKIIIGWTDSNLADLRKLAKTVIALPLWTIYMNNEDACHATGYPFHGDPRKKANPHLAKPSYDFQFEQISDELAEIETEILVIGSGSGGGVAAATLAQAGHQVLVVDKGVYIKTENVTGSAKEGFKAMYEAGGIMVAEEGAISVLAASTWGGGSAVNWSASLRPPQHMREMWDKTYGLPHFTSEAYDESLKVVCDRMGVSSDHIKHSYANNTVIAGADRLGIHVENIPQNTGGNVHECGFCGHGCPFGEKQGSLVTWLRDAAKHGARFMQQIKVERLLFGSDRSSPIVITDTKSNSPSATNNICVGALVSDPTGKRAIIRAKKSVVVSGGSINTPAILMRSGLKNPNIGKNLHLHPVSLLFAEYKDDVRPWEGSIMTAISDAGEDRNGSFFGSKLEVLAPTAAFYGALPPWRGSTEHKKRMINYRHSAAYIVLTRDREGGQITIDKDGNPLISYVPSAYDRQSMTAGLITSARILLAAGATKIGTSQAFMEQYVPAPDHQGDQDPAFLAWLDKVRRAGVPEMGGAVGSAHQMGSCQMGTRPSRSAVDPRGRVWGTEGLYVADASVFPTASGVNPMITTMSTAHSIATFAAQDLAQAAGVGQSQAKL